MVVEERNYSVRSSVMLRRLAHHATNLEETQS